MKTRIVLHSFEELSFVIVPTQNGATPPGHVGDATVPLVPEGQLSLHSGDGARVRLRDNGDVRVGKRVPLGLSDMLESVPGEVFLEVAGILDSTPSTRGGVTAGTSARSCS